MKKILLSLFILLNLTIASAQGFFEFSFNDLNGYRNDALLYIDAYNRVSLRVKFYDPDALCYRVVDQGCSTTTGPRGIAILCSTVVWGGTNTNASNYYAPDNFFLGRDNYGKPLLFNIDSNGTYSSVYGLRQIQTYMDYLLAYNKYIKQ